MEEIDGIEVDLSLLPDELQHLAPLIRRYAVGDDVERSRIEEESSREELVALTQAVEPHWPAIHEYLDAHLEQPGTPEQDVALVLMSLSEAAAEVDVELGERDVD